MASPPTEAKGAGIGGALPRFSWGTSLAVLVVLGLTGWSVYGTEFDLLKLLTGGGAIERFVSEMFPPDLSAGTLRSTTTGILQTLQMSFLGAVIGAVVALPLAALGTRSPGNAGASRRERALKAVPYHAARFVLNIFRSVPDILWALIFVVALGLGPFPGTLALAVHSAGVLGKLYSEALEAVPGRPSEALTASGAGPLQTFLFARLPQAAAGFASLSLYQWECNIRSATILGFVGAGGIGQEILIAMNLFNYSKVATLVGATVVVVLAVDRLSALIRARLIV
ncbi:phosphonate ABC transporter, permease protein PhnE [Rubrobacter indicoceani]|uniref:phosphonate ABC transporter, permease protein PhnE n=1 Tax=Rubrobacter indicoceani TaxID=2051957 RepID=UPI000E5A7390|nr:phosphonate ABC transporter, permease protein PhnE [Rubrobacter indicoceani]